ncbi:MAG: CHAT domain-containing protein [Halobacteriota archaeon]
MAYDCAVRGPAAGQVCTSVAAVSPISCLAGEGVLGLRRAFMPAGVKTLVMSLWSVPDEATKELMVDFYRRTLAGEGRTAALRNA